MENENGTPHFETAINLRTQIWSSIYLLNLELNSVTK